MKRNSVISFVLILAIFLSGCGTTLNHVKDQQTMDEMKAKYPLLPLFYVHALECEGYIVIEKSSLPIQSSLYSFTLDYVKNESLIFEMSLKAANKSIQIFYLTYDFLGHQGKYRILQEKVENLNPEILKQFSSFIDESLILYLVNNLLLLFDEQWDILQAKDSFPYKDFVFKLKDKLVSEAEIRNSLYYLIFNYNTEKYKEFNGLLYPELIDFDINNILAGKILIKQIKPQFVYFQD